MRRGLLLLELLDWLGPDLLRLSALVNGHVAQVVDKVRVIAIRLCKLGTGMAHFGSLRVVKSGAATLANVSKVLLDLGIQFFERAG